MTKTKRQLRVGDVLDSERTGERLMVIAADEEHVWLRAMKYADVTKVEDGHVWLRLEGDDEHRCTHTYAHTVFKLEDDDDQD